MVKNSAISTNEAFSAPGRWANYELQTALLDDLFQSQRRQSISTTKRTFHEITALYDYRYDGGIVPNGLQIQVTAPEGLGVGAESILLAVLYLFKHHGSAGSTGTSKMLMKPAGIAEDYPIGTLETTRYAVLKAAGMGDDQASYQRLQRILRDLGKITLTFRNLVTGEEGNDFLVRWDTQKSTNRLLVQINWRLAGAVFGTYLRAMVDLDERNSLPSDPSKTLHRWLSAHLWPGKSEHILYPTLIKHMWPEEDQDMSSSTYRMRIHRLKNKIIPEIQTLSGWRITTSATGILIQRLQRVNH